MTDQRPPLYLIRHATPDWTRRDIPYDIPPGPPLTPKGEAEARELGRFLHENKVSKLYYSPLERTTKTAHLAAEVSKIEAVLHPALSEWRNDESEADLKKRFEPVLDTFLHNADHRAPIGLVTHGGPIGVMLTLLGIDPERLKKHRGQFDHSNPIPPAGAWRVQQKTGSAEWQLDLVFEPKVAK